MLWHAETFSLLLLFCVRVLCAETVVPVCPPACGLTYYGGVSSISATFSMVLVAFFVTVIW